MAEITMELLIAILLSTHVPLIKRLVMQMNTINILGANIFIERNFAVIHGECASCTALVVMDGIIEK